jgi:parvulin-like peptidyl-prolyl isomerase
MLDHGADEILNNTSSGGSSPAASACRENGRLLRRPVFVLHALLSCLSLPAFSQNGVPLPQDTIARIGASVITARDLIQRVELMPFPERRSKTDADSAKMKAVHAMVAEKVLAHEARRLGLAEDARTRLMRQELENLFVRDELYRREIVARTTPSQQEMTVGMSRFVKENKVISFLVRTEADGEKLSRVLRRCKSDSVMMCAPASLYTEADTLTVRFGAPDTAFENAAYAIDRSRVSKPFSSATFGWAVLYLLDRYTSPEAAQMNPVDRHRRVEHICQGRRESERAGQYYFEVLKTKHARADAGCFALLADSIVALWKEDTTYFFKHGAYQLSSDLVDLIAMRLKHSLDSTLVWIDDGNLSLGQVLEMFRYRDFSSRALEGEPFMRELNEAIKDLVAKELLVREGRKQGLQYSPGVQSDVRLWSDYWAARALYYHIRDSVSVSDEEIAGHLVKNNEFFGRYYEVNVREVLCDSLGEVEAVLDEMRRGRSLADLASRYSRRPAWAKNDGESGFFQVGQHPELGFQAMMADTGRLCGPLKHTEGYSLYEVLGKRRTREGVVAFDTLMQNVRNRLLREKQKATIDSYIARLAREQHASVDREKIKAIKLTDVPMFTRRLIGFGGRMAAAPMLMKQWDWIKEFLQTGESVP